MKLLGIFRADFNVTDQPLIIYCIFIKHHRENGNTMEQYISFY